MVKHPTPAVPAVSRTSPGHGPSTDVFAYLATGPVGELVTGQGTTTVADTVVENVAALPIGFARVVAHLIAVSFTGGCSPRSYTGSCRCRWSSGPTPATTAPPRAAAPAPRTSPVPTREATS